MPSTQRFMMVLCLLPLTLQVVTSSVTSPLLHVVQFLDPFFPLPVSCGKQGCLVGSAEGPIFPPGPQKRRSGYDSSCLLFSGAFSNGFVSGFRIPLSLSSMVVCIVRLLGLSLQMTFGNKCFQKLLLQVRYRTFLCSATDRHGFPPSPALKAVSARIVFHDGTRWLVLTFAASPVFNLIPAFLKSISAEINLDPDAAYPVQLILRRLPALLQ